jgi:hypothetical protein
VSTTQSSHITLASTKVCRYDATNLNAIIIRWYSTDQWLLSYISTTLSNVFDLIAVKNKKKDQAPANQQQATSERALHVSWISRPIKGAAIGEEL